MDEGHLKKLAGHTVRERPECQDCFCKWHCAGDCIAKNMVSDNHPGEGLKLARCLINQELTRDQLIRRLKDSTTIMERVAATMGDDEDGLVPLGEPSSGA